MRAAGMGRLTEYGLHLGDQKEPDTPMLDHFVALQRAQSRRNLAHHFMTGGAPLPGN